MNPIYPRLEATAKRLIAAYGKECFVVRKTLSGPAHAPVETPVNHGCILVDIGYKLSLISETLIQAGDKSGIMSPAVDIVPDTKDDIIIDGETYHIAIIMPLNPGGLTLLYEYVARK